MAKDTSAIETVLDGVLGLTGSTLSKVGSAVSTAGNFFSSLSSSSPPETLVKLSAEENQALLELLESYVDLDKSTLKKR